MLRKMISFVIMLSLLLTCAVAEAPESAQAITITVSDFVYISGGEEYPLTDVKGVLSYRWYGPSIQEWESLTMDMHVEKGGDILFPILAFETPDMNIAMRFGEGDVIALDLKAMTEALGMEMPENASVTEEEMQTWLSGLGTFAAETVGLPEPTEAVIETEDEVIDAQAYTFTVTGDMFMKILEYMFDTHPVESFRSLKDIYMEAISVSGSELNVELTLTGDGSHFIVNCWDDASALYIEKHGDTALVSFGIGADTFACNVAWSQTADFTDNITGVEPVKTYTSLDALIEDGETLTNAVMPILTDAQAFMEDEEFMALVNAICNLFVDESGYVTDCTVEDLPFAMPEFTGAPEGYECNVDVCYAYEDGTGVADMTFANSEGKSFTMMVNNYVAPGETSYLTIADGALQPIAESGTVIVADGNPAYCYSFFKNDLSFALYDYDGVLAPEEVAAFIDGIH